MKKVIIFCLIILFFTKTQNVFVATRVFAVDNILVTGELNNNNYRQKYSEIALCPTLSFAENVPSKSALLS